MIFVTGSTGNIGRALLQELAALGAPARALVSGREEALVAERLGIEPVVGRFEDEDSLRRAMIGAERLFLLSPAGTEAMVTQQTRLVDLAREAGVAHVVKQSSIAAEEEAAPGIIRAHRRIERHIERCGLAWTHLRPNWFMQNELGQAESIAREGAFYAPDVARITPIDARDVAAVAAQVLTGDGHEGRAYVLTGPEPLSYADVAERYARVLGSEVNWVEVTLERARESMLAAGLSPELAQGFTEIMRRYRDGGVTQRVSPSVRALLGRDPRTFEQFVGDHRTAFVHTDPVAGTDALTAVGLPMRHGSPPETSRPSRQRRVAHSQRSQIAPEELQEELYQRALSLPGVSASESLVSVPGARAFVLDQAHAHGPDEAFQAGREFAHAHPASDGSLHMTLPADVARAVVRQGWGEPHPLSETPMVFGPRDREELAVVWRLLRASYDYAAGSR